jgi:hypothetical protein
MMELLGGGVMGSVLGGVFRLVPEFLKAFDRKNERGHELAMFDRQCKLEEQRGQQKLAEIGAAREAAIDIGVIESFKAAIEQQTEMTKAAGGWVASLSASVRPVITYWVLAIWSFVHVWYAYNAWVTGADAKTVFTTIMSADFAALVAGTLNYWFLDRTLARRGL